MELHTPIGHHRLHFLELRSSHDKSREVRCLQLVWNMGGHADGNILKGKKKISAVKGTLIQSMWLPMTRRRRGGRDGGAGRFVVQGWTRTRLKGTLGKVIAALVLVPKFDNLIGRRTPRQCVEHFSTAY
jgi:hypothetical protein